MSVVVIATITPKPSDHAAARDALVALIPRVHEEDGCELYALHEGEPGQLVFIESWVSRQALDAHGKGPVVAEMNARLDGLVAAAARVVIVDAVPAGDGAKGRLLPA